MKLSNEELSLQIDNFLDFCFIVKGYTPTTITTYSLNLFESIKYIEIYEEGENTIINLMPYRIKLKGKEKKTIYKKISIFRSFISFLNDNDFNIIVENDENVSVAKTLPKPILNRYIDEALQKCKVEDRVLILLVYALGLRISEVVNLKIKDIENSWVTIKGKSDKIRQLPLLKNVNDLLDEYLEYSLNKEFVFEKNGVGLNQNQLRYKITSVFKEIGLKVTPHQLRHSFATELLQNGARIGDVSELLGHSSLESTQIYTKLSSTLKMDNYQKAHPLGKKDTFV